MIPAEPGRREGGLPLGRSYSRFRIEEDLSTYPAMAASPV
jgi:hypothetical protein